MLEVLESFPFCLWSTRFGGADEEEFLLLLLAFGGDEVVDFLIEESEFEPVDRSYSGL